jgi:C-terminal processing protease CtpA/Prc
MMPKQSLSRGVLLFVGMLILGAGAPDKARSQNFEPNTEPSLGLAFPLEQKDGSVRIPIPIMISLDCVVPAGSVARTLWQMPQPDDREVRKANKRKDLEQSYSRKPIKVQNQDKDDLHAAQVKVAQERALGTVWTEAIKFQAVLHRLRMEDYFFTYQDSQTGAMESRSFQFPDGLFLGDKGGAIEVLAVQHDSRAQKVGMKAGMRIVSVNGKETSGMAVFQKILTEASVDRDKTGNPVLFKVVGKDGGEPIEIGIRPPPSFNRPFDPFENF